jgi:hypothetical protein
MRIGRADCGRKSVSKTPGKVWIIPSILSPKIYRNIVLLKPKMPFPRYIINRIIETWKMAWKIFTNRVGKTVGI